jgi:hypothetical protein
MAGTNRLLLFGVLVSAMAVTAPAVAAAAVSAPVRTFRDYPDRTVTTIAWKGCRSTLTVWKTLYGKQSTTRMYACEGKVGH